MQDHGANQNGEGDDYTNDKQAKQRILAGHNASPVKGSSLARPRQGNVKWGVRALTLILAVYFAGISWRAFGEAFRW